MADAQTSSLYEQDFYLWALDQARAVRDLHDQVANANAPRDALDWDNLVEELEGLARAVRSEPRSRLITIVEHLVKLQLSTASDPRHGWRDTVRRSRLDIELLLEDNPSLDREVPLLLESAAMTKAARGAIDDLVRRGEIPTNTAAPGYTRSQIMEHWFPDRDEAIP